MTVPKSFQIANSAGKPQGKGSDLAKTCRSPGCGLRIDQHSGMLCRCCLAPIEHHNEVNPFEECLAGRRRMAAAREAAGVDLDWTDRLALR